MANYYSVVSRAESHDTKLRVTDMPLKSPCRALRCSILAAWHRFLAPATLKSLRYHLKNRAGFHSLDLKHGNLDVDWNA